MNRVTAAAATIAAAMLLASCANEGDEVRLAEPVLDFPYTSTTPTPTPEETTTEEEEEEEEETTTSTTSKTSTSTSTRSASSRPSAARQAPSEPEPAREPEPAPPLPGAACAWPSQAEADGREFSTFCDREWARTMLDGQQYFWASEGGGWATVDPAGMKGQEVCWAREDFKDAPEAIRNAAVFCTDEEAPAPSPTTSPAETETPAES